LRSVYQIAGQPPPEETFFMSWNLVVSRAKPCRSVGWQKSRDMRYS
jgi:hypothetical protein